MSTPPFDTATPNVARMYDYWLGGTDNFEADRQAAEAVRKIRPNVAEQALDNKRFQTRAVTYVAGHGVRQFLDIGSGLPTSPVPAPGAEPQWLATHEAARQVMPDAMVAYVDHDSIAVQHSRVLLGDGHGSFTKAPGSPFPAGEQPWGFALGDINGDGISDVAVIPNDHDLKDHSQLTVRILFGDGHGHLTPRHGPPLSLEGCAGIWSVAIGDVNNDGDADVAVFCAQNNKIALFLGSQDGAFQRLMIDVPTGTAGWGRVAIGDVNDSGAAAIIVDGADKDVITVLQSR